MSPSVSKVNNIPPALGSNIKKGLSRKATALVAAVGITVGSMGGAVIKDTVTAATVNNQYNNLKNTLVENGAPKEFVDNMAAEIEYAVDSSSPWYEAKSIKSMKKLLGFQMKVDEMLANYAAKKAYEQGIQDTIDYLMMQGMPQSEEVEPAPKLNKDNLIHVNAFMDKAKNFFSGFLKTKEV